MTGPLNGLLWGSELWCLKKSNLVRLRSFHHSAICRMLGITWKQAREEKIMNEEVRKRFDHIPDNETFITRPTWKYIGKAVRATKNLTPKRIMGAQI